MSRSFRRAGATTAVLCSLGVTGLVLGATMASVSGSAPSTSPGATERTVAETSEAGFSDGADARAAAEELIATYIESEFDVAVTDVACSVPDSGDVGATFACYALKPDELVIALRATVGPQRLVELELLLDEQTTTTTTTTPTQSTSSPT